LAVRIVAVWADKAVFGFVISQLTAVSLVFSPFGDCNPCNSYQDRCTKDDSRRDPASAYAVR
jgi:hypothetical protein